MSAVRQIGIKMTVDAQSVTTELPRISREFDNMGGRAEQAAERTTRSLARVNMSVRDIIQGAAGLHVAAGGLSAITEAIRALPREGFNYAKDLEVSQVGMAGILGSMTAINGRQTEYNQALQISSEYIRKLNDDALRTAASSQELTQVFQALMAPGLGAKMTLDEIRQLTVVGTNAVKSMGLSGAQVVQELRDLVAGGITASGSTLATALGLKDSDIAKAKASSEGLFAFLMERLQGFQASSEAFNNTLKGKLDSVKEGAVRVAAEGMSPLIEATKTALDDVSRLFVTFDANKNATLNPTLVSDLRSFSQGLADAAAMGRSAIAVVWENRSAVMALATAYGAIKIGAFVAEMGSAIAAKREAAQASRLLVVQQAAETAGDAQVITSSRAKVAAYLAELEANAARARGEVAAQAAQIATLQTTQEAIVVARADVVAKMNATRATMAQAEAQIAAARAAGAQSMALALVREGTQTLTAAQARHAALLAELATLGRQQAGVQASIAAATTASTAAQTAATAATTRLTAAQSAASMAGRTFGTVMGALGGPVGIAIAALTVLIGKLVEASFEASKAAKVGQSKERVDAAVAGGGQAEERDLARIRGKIEELREKRDELLLDKKDGGFLGWVFGNDYQVGVDSKLRTTNAEIDALSKSLNSAEQAAKSATGQTGELSLTVTGTEQAWRKANDGIKTATAIQSDYNDKLSESKASWKAYKKALEQDGASPEKIKELQKEQTENEKALAVERDKQIKSLSAGAATARSHGIDAEIAATKHGYKLLAAQTAESIADVDAQRRMGSMGDSDALAKRTELQLADVDAQRNALQAELALLKGKKESAKEQANIVGELAELAQRRVSIEAAAAREQREIDAKAADELEARITAQQKAAQQTQENVRTAKLDQQEIGVTGAALGKLRQARVEETAAQLESQARTMDGIDLSGRAGEALRQQAADVRELAKTQGYNASAKMVEDYAKAVDLANAATQFEQSLAAMSQRDRDIAIEQYRIAVDLQEKLRQIKADNPNDEGAVERLSAKATATAAKAQADAANKVYVRETTRTVDQINDVFRKGFADMVNEGVGTWDAFTRSLATSFKTSVADELYKAFAQPFVVPVVASVQGVINGLIQGGANALGLAGGSNLLGLASNASSLYSLTTGNSLLGQAANWLGIGSSAAAAGTGLGLTAASAGAGAIGAGIGSSIGLGAAGTAAGTGLGLTAGASGLGMTAGSAGASVIGGSLGTSAAVTSGAVGAGAGAGGLTGAFAAVPGWGWALAGGAMLLSQMDLGSRGANHAGAAYSTAGLGNAKSAEALFGRAAGDWYDDLTARHDASLEAQLGKSVNALSGVYKSLASFAGDSAKQIDIVAGFAKNPVHGDEDNYGYFKLIDKLNGATLQEYTQRDGGLGTDPTAAYTKFATDMANGLLAQLRASGGLEKWVDDSLAKLGDAPSLEALATAVEQINAAQAALTQFGLAMPQFAAQSDAARAALMDQAGGSQALVERLGSFYSNYFSEAERTAVATQQVTEQLQALGYAMPTSRDEYRAWVTTAIEAGESGTKSAAGLLKLESAVAQLLPASKDAAAGVTAAAKALRSAADIASKEQDLQIQLLRAQGSELAAVALERKRELAALGEYGSKAQDMQQQIYAAQDAATAEKARQEAAAAAAAAAAEAAAAAAQIAQERLGLESQLLQLLGDTTALRQRELAALDASNRSLQERIWAVEDAQAAQEAARNLMQSAYSGVERAVAAERSTINARLQAQQAGNKAQIEAAQEASRAVQSIAAALSRAAKTVQVESAAQDWRRLQDARTLIEGAAQAPDISKVVGLEDALSVAGQDSRKFYATFADYAYDQAVTSSVIKSLDTRAQQQLSTAEAVVAALTAQDQAARAIADEQLLALDEQLNTAKLQLDAALGNVQETKTVAAAIADLANATRGYAAATAAAAVARASATSAVSAGAAAGSAGATASRGGSGEYYRDAGGNLVEMQPGSSREFLEAVAASGTSAVSSLPELRDRLVAAGKTDVWESLVSGLKVGSANWGVEHATIVDSIGRIVEVGPWEKEKVLDWVTEQGILAATAQGGGGVLAGQRDWSYADIAREVQTALALGSSVDQVLASGKSNYGVSEADIRAAAEKAGIPGFDVGTNYLPQDMLAIVHAGERIVPAADNRRLFEALEGGSDASQASTLLRVLDVLLRMEPALRSIASSTLDASKALAKQLDRAELQSAQERKAAAQGATA